MPSKRPSSNKRVFTTIFTWLAKVIFLAEFHININLGEKLTFFTILVKLFDINTFKGNQQFKMVNKFKNDKTKFGY